MDRILYPFPREGLAVTWTLPRRTLASSHVTSRTRNRIAHDLDPPFVNRARVSLHLLRTRVAFPDSFGTPRRTSRACSLRCRSTPDIVGRMWYVMVTGLLSSSIREMSAC